MKLPNDGSLTGKYTNASTGNFVYAEPTSHYLDSSNYNGSNWPLTTGTTCNWITGYTGNSTSHSSSATTASTTAPGPQNMS